MKVLLIDNYDSFTWNLVHYLILGGVEVTVRHNDDITAEEITNNDYSGLVISPGPCTPQDAGLLMPLLAEVVDKLPILGVCLGHQAIGMHFGCRLVHADEPVHGKASNINHDGAGIFSGLPNPMKVGRYHSLVLDKIYEDSPLQVSATCGNEIMAFRHKYLPIEGVQFHPESVLTPEGQSLITNWTAGLS
ncbi:MAG: glutamine amidotransferase of anthranilate synthase [Bacteroidota bacterium]|jgi:anthranilate synthase component 2